MVGTCKVIFLPLTEGLLCSLCRSFAIITLSIIWRAVTIGQNLNSKLRCMWLTLNSGLFFTAIPQCTNIFYSLKIYFQCRMPACISTWNSWPDRFVFASASTHLVSWVTCWQPARLFWRGLSHMMFIHVSQRDSTAGCVSKVASDLKKAQKYT